MLKAIFFDVFGTLVDWRKSLIDQIIKTKIIKENETSKKDIEKSKEKEIKKKIINFLSSSINSNFRFNSWSSYWTVLWWY